jgi:hypothetical protein
MTNTDQESPWAREDERPRKRSHKPLAALLIIVATFIAIPFLTNLTAPPPKVTAEQPLGASTAANDAWAEKLQALKGQPLPEVECYLATRDGSRYVVQANQTPHYYATIAEAPKDALGETPPTVDGYTQLCYFNVIVDPAASRSDQIEATLQARGFTARSAQPNTVAHINEFAPTDTFANLVALDLNRGLYMGASDLSVNAVRVAFAEGDYSSIDPKVLDKIVASVSDEDYAILNRIADGILA